MRQRAHRQDAPFYLFPGECRRPRHFRGTGMHAVVVAFVEAGVARASCFSCALEVAC